MKRSTEDTPESTRATGDGEPLDRLLRHARRDGFTPKETEEVWNQLGAILGAPRGGGASGSPAATSGSRAWSAWSAKTIAVLAIGGAVAAGGLAARGVIRNSAAPTGSGGSRALSEGDRPSPTAAESSVGGPGIEPNGSIESKLETLPQTRSTASSSLTADSASRSPGLHRALVKPHAGIGVVDMGPPNAAVASSLATGTAPSPAEAMQNEGALLLRARRELGPNPTETLNLVDQHSRLFPAGTLVPEREVLAIEALVNLGRLHEARTRLADFRAHFPESPHLARLDGMVGR